MKPLVVDFHTHVLKNPLYRGSQSAPLSSIGEKVVEEQVDKLRYQARSWLKPFTTTVHEAQTLLRYLPRTARDSLDSLNKWLPLPGLLIESMADDLLLAMNEASVDYAVILAHPPLISNEFILEIASRIPRFLPVVSFPKDTPKAGTLLRRYIKQGARGLKFDPPLSCTELSSRQNKSLLKIAEEQGLPVILNCAPSPLIMRNLGKGGVERFRPWLEIYRNVRFIFAHMNFHDPNQALDLCEQFGQVYVDTSRQPAEIVGEAVRRIGADRVLFASDWPWVGNNLGISRKRIEDCVEIGLLSSERSRLVLGENAAKLLKLS